MNLENRNMWLTSLVISVALMWECTAEISGVVEPYPTNHVGEGNTAVFTCNVTGRDRSTQTLLWQLAYRTSSAGQFTYLYYPVDMTMIKRINLTETPWTHGQYYMSYFDENNGVENIQLQIVNVTKDDRNFRFNCAYRTQSPNVKTIIIGNLVKLTVWEKPVCDSVLHGGVPPVIKPNDTILITLTCSNALLALKLSWYKVDDNGMRVAIENGTLLTNTLGLIITLHDYGREYICGATIANVVDFELTCTTFPFNPQPEFSYNTLVIGSGDNFTALCTFNEAPTPKTNFFWYIGSTLLIENKDKMVQISQTETDSSLFLGNEYLPSGNSIITCEAVVTDTARLNKSVTVTVVSKEPIGPSITISPLTTKTATTDVNSAREVPPVIIYAAAAGGLVLVIVLIIIVCCCLRRKRVSSKTKNNSIIAMEPSVATKEGSIPKQIIQSDVQVTYDALNINTVPSHSPTISPDGNPVYAMPDKSRSYDASNINNVPSYSPTISPDGAPVYAMPDKSRSRKASQQNTTPERKLSHYEDVGESRDSDMQMRDNIKVSSDTRNHSQYEDEPDAYDDVSVPAKNESRLSKALKRKKSANVEGLLYADVDIASGKTSTSGENNEGIVRRRTDNLTVYTQVRI